MRTILASTAIILSLGLVACGDNSGTQKSQAPAQTETAQVDDARTVLEKREKVIKAGDLDGLMGFYADDAVLVAPAGVVAGEENRGGMNVFFGKENVRKFFAVLTGPEVLPAVQSMAATYDVRPDGGATMTWAQWPGTEKEVSGTDVWVIKNGKIVSQVVLVNPPKAPAK